MERNLINVFIAAVIGIVSFALMIMPGDYYKTPMGVIGKVYANSMLVVINSRMRLLGPEETTLRMISVLQFGTAPPNNKNSVGT